MCLAYIREELVSRFVFSGDDVARATLAILGNGNDCCSNITNINESMSAVYRSYTFLQIFLKDPSHLGIFFEAGTHNECRQQQHSIKLIQ